MPKAVRILAWLVGGFVAFVALLVGGTLGYVFVVKPSKRAAQPLVAPSTPAAVAQGKYLAENVYQCVWCHSDVDSLAPGAPVKAGVTLGGRDFEPDSKKDLPEGFRLRTPNISRDRRVGIGTWTDGEIVRAMREGIRQDGTAVFDFMPYATYRSWMSDDDALAIVAYLRSHDANPAAAAPLEVPWYVRILGARLHAEPVDVPFAGVKPGPTKERGELLLHAAMCHFRHDATDEASQPIEGKELSGGMKTTLRDGTVVAGPNITSDPVVGIGAYTDDDLMKVLSQGVGKSGAPLRWMPTASIRGLTDDDKRAIIAALRASKPVR